MKTTINKLYLLLCGLVLTGVLVIMYPSFQQGIYSDSAQQNVRDFNEKISDNLPDDLQDLYDEMLEYNKNLHLNNQEKLTNATAYEQLDFSMVANGFENEMVGYITIPDMDIELPLYLGATPANMKLGAVRLSQTSLPIGGNNTNTVIAAHRGMATAAMFRDIETLAIGDSVYLTNPFETLEYKVTDLQVISPNNLDAVLIKEGKDMITLITCHPYRFNYQRYVVYCEAV